jgi:hypothetical protein
MTSPARATLASARPSADVAPGSGLMNWRSCMVATVMVGRAYRKGGSFAALTLPAIAEGWVR